tara:strand:+ start:223 stop:612 length:390 start_codon:yes stop_codon:yes gene_type:complete
MDNLKHIDRDKRALMLDENIQTMINNITDVPSFRDDLHKDYLVYKSLILLCNELFVFILVKTESKENLFRIYQQYLNQSESEIHNFMDYVISQFTISKLPQVSSEGEKKAIINKLTLRLEKDNNNRRTQ